MANIFPKTDERHKATNSRSAINLNGINAKKAKSMNIILKLQKISSIWRKKETFSEEQHKIYSLILKRNNARQRQ